MTKNLYIIRGLPGSGKTTMADALVALASDKMIRLEADNYFIKNGVYQYDAAFITKAHEHCKQCFLRAMSKGLDIIISNTSVKTWEWSEYKTLAEKEGYMVHIVVKENHHDGMTIHDVPMATVMRMKRNFNVNLLGKQLSNSRSYTTTTQTPKLGQNRLGYE